MPLNIEKLTHEYVMSLPPKVINHISPSQVGNCLRVHYLMIKHIAPSTPKSAQEVLNMQSGFWWEEFIDKALRYAGVEYFRSLKLYEPKINMEGEIDFVVVRDGGKHVDIYDGKSEQFGAKAYRGEGYLQSHPEYVHQMNSYALLLMHRGYDVEDGGFMVNRRDKTEVESINFSYDPASVKATVDRIKLLNSYLEREELPPCDGRYCSLGMCDYGNPLTKKGNKITECCGTIEQINRWRDAA